MPRLFLVLIMSVVLLLVGGYAQALVVHPEDSAVVALVDGANVCFNNDGNLVSITECDNTIVDEGFAGISSSNWFGGTSGIKACGTDTLSAVSNATCVETFVVFAACESNRYVLVQTIMSGHYFALKANASCTAIATPESAGVVPCLISDSFDEVAGCAPGNPPVITVEGGYIQLDTSSVPPDIHCAETSHDGRMVVDSVNGLLYICTQTGWKKITPGECATTPGDGFPEVCDGLDNDCNGTPDDGLISPACVTQAGVCAGSEQTCGGTAGWLACDPTNYGADYELQEYTCDGLDNDCDGAVDEDLPLSLCAQQQGVCAGSFQTCGGSSNWLQCGAAEYGPDYESTETSCDGLDNDCDGEFDEGFAGLGGICTVGLGVCQQSGVLVCDENGSQTVCSAIAGTPTEEICDGLDNDCDGEVDEGFAGLGGFCTVGVGVCQQSGLLVCDGDGSQTVCNATEGVPTEEICDGVDNDCDGSFDEDWRIEGVYVANEACGNCNTDCTDIYNRPNAYGECDTSGVPFCQMSCCSIGDSGSCDGEFDYLDINGIPDDGCEFQVDPTAIYVSAVDPAGDNGSGCGWDISRPCLGIGVGLDEAEVAGRTKVLVADGSYHESVTIRSGIDLLGGYKPDTWERNLAGTSTTVYGNSDTIDTKTIEAENISTETLVEGFVIYGENNTNTGGNSYAVWVVNSTSALTFSNNRVYGGQGGQGQNGSNATSQLDGQAGDPGDDFIETTEYDNSLCNSDPDTPGAGGTGGASSCGTGGGAGAGARCPVSNTQQLPGVNGTTGTGGASGGAGGPGGYDSYTTDCSQFITGGQSAVGQPGSAGSSGDDGNPGAGCSDSTGGVSFNEWRASSASSGLAGDHGGGGGGGGAGGGADFQPVFCGGIQDSLGGSGGGGGSGGCAGAGGGNGSGGGGSFGIFVSFDFEASDVPVISNNVIQRGQGGQGGDGGQGGTGSEGGLGGLGGTVVGATWSFALGNGGDGGDGGQGGHGGGGGGGCGGVSYGIYVNNVSSYPEYGPMNTFSAGGGAGSGGFGGASLGNSGSDGSDGASGETNN